MSTYFTKNKLAYWEQSAGYLRGEPVVPVTWELDLTTTCNQACPGCSGNRFFPTTMTPEQAVQTVEWIKGAGAKGLILTGGGDPTIARRQLIAVMGMMPTLLFTHGELFDEELARAVLPHLEGIRFSLDAYSGNTAIKWRGITPQRWETTLENIERAVAIKKELGLTLPIGAAYLTDKERNGGILSFADIANALGVDYAQYRPMLWSTAKQELPDWDYPSFKELYDIAKGRYPEMVTCSQQKYDLIASGEAKRPYSKCHTGRFATTVGADGKVYFCCHTRYMPSFCLGDLKTETLEEIFASDRVEQMQEKMSFEVCPVLCRGDAINRVVTDMQDNQPDHLMFL